MLMVILSNHERRAHPSILDALRMRDCFSGRQIR